MAERDFKGIWIPKEIWLNKDLTLMEKLFFIEIDSLDGPRGCYASNAHFAEFFDISKQRCSQIISSLEKKGVINVELIRSGKQVKSRTVRVSNKFDRGIKKNFQGCQENAKGSNTSSGNTKPTGFDPKKAVYPDNLNQSAWFEWCDYRAAKKKKISKEAFAKQVKNLAGFSYKQQQEMINQSISNDWTGLFSPNENSNGITRKSAADQVRAACGAQRI